MSRIVRTWALTMIAYIIGTTQMAIVWRLNATGFDSMAIGTSAALLVLLIVTVAERSEDGH